jgi:Raf kinase inhibitor-like YbhB/YbcL family protein
MKKIKVLSPKFSNNETIPVKYTCQGEDISPPLVFEGIPPQAKSIAIIVDDPDAPVGVFDHWLAWNILPTKTKLEEREIPPCQGANHFGEICYRGPCPPRGKAHRYYFRVWVLDKMLTLSQGAYRKELEEAMHLHIIAYGELVGLYQR